MGNSASSSGRGHHEETVDFGHLCPQGVYTGPGDWNQAIVSQLICARRLAPFYRPLEEYDDSWDDDQILAARKELPMLDSDTGETITRIETASSSSTSTKSSHKRPGSLKEPSKPEAAVYRGAVECPICFLYYPPNINHSRCCDQAICTECFVQIKRIDPTPTHLVSEPACCPYCVQDNFGIVYRPPPWRAGIGSESSSFWGEPPRNAQQFMEPPSHRTHKRRQKSFGADSPEVVLIDHIRPDWEAKLAAVRATVARRANRRIIMRQVGDRLIPVGVTSGRHVISPEDGGQSENAENAGSRRSRRRVPGNTNQNLEQFMGMAGQDLEELMLMEAMRLSLIDHEEHQRKEAEEKKKQVAALAESEAEFASTSGTSPSQLASSSADHSRSHSTSPTSIPVPISQPQPHDLLSVPGSISFSSSRTRTPTPSGSPLSGSPARSSDLSSSSRNRRTPSPAPFSTLTAAMSAVSTASAILGTSVNGAAESSSADSASGTSGSQFKHPHGPDSLPPEQSDPPPPQPTASVA